MSSMASVLMLALMLRLVQCAPTEGKPIASSTAEPDAELEKEVTTEATEHHIPFQLHHLHFHHRHYHHYRDRAKHWLAAVLVAVVLGVAAACSAVGLWRRLCAFLRRTRRRPRHPTPSIALAVDAPLLPTPLAASLGAKDVPPPYQETWT